MGAIKYVRSFKCVVMAALWLTILVSIDYRNQVLQARDATIDVEVDSLESLLADISDLRKNHWTSILAESKNVASALGIHTEFEKHRPRKGCKHNEMMKRETNEAPTPGTLTGQLFAEAEENDCIAENTFKQTSR